jgi:hypothetical protein
MEGFERLGVFKRFDGVNHLWGSLIAVARILEAQALSFSKETRRKDPCSRSPTKCGKRRIITEPCFLSASCLRHPARTGVHPKDFLDPVPDDRQRVVEQFAIPDSLER